MGMEPFWKLCLKMIGKFKFEEGNFRKACMFIRNEYIYYLVFKKFLNSAKRKFQFKKKNKELLNKKSSINLLFTS